MNEIREPCVRDELIGLPKTTDNQTSQYITMINFSIGIVGHLSPTTKQKNLPRTSKNLRVVQRHLNVSIRACKKIPDLSAVLVVTLTYIPVYFRFHYKYPDC